jgi:drug/metabolite transporter (DMT)-like permease
VLAAALVRAGNVVLIGRLSARSREHDRERAQLRPLNLTMVQMVVGTACTLPLAVPDLTRAPRALGNLEFWAVLVALTVGGEHLTGVALTGCLLILASCWWGQSIEAAHRRDRR